MQGILTDKQKARLKKHLLYSLRKFETHPTHEGWRIRTAYLSHLLQELSPRVQKRSAGQADKLRQKMMKMREATLRPLHIRSEQIRQAYAMQKELIDRHFPGLPVREVLHLDNEHDVNADDGLLKIGERAFQSENALRFVTLHALIHYASGDRFHGEAFLSLEANLGMLGTSNDLMCYVREIPANLLEAPAPTPLLTAGKAESEMPKVEPGIGLKYVRLRMNRIFREYFKQVGDRRIKGSENVDKLHRAWIILEQALIERKGLIPPGSWEWATEDDILEPRTHSPRMLPQLPAPALIGVGTPDYSSRGSYPTRQKADVFSDESHWIGRAVNEKQSFNLTEKLD